MKNVTLRKHVIILAAVGAKCDQNILLMIQKCKYIFSFRPTLLVQHIDEFVSDSYVILLNIPREISLCYLVQMSFFLTFT